MIATATQAIAPRTLVRESSSFCSGDLLGATAESMVAIWPIWVPMPVSVTTIAPVPRVTEVFWNSMLVRSPRATSSRSMVEGSLLIGALSPVSAASWVSRVAERISRPSAGTMSPDSRFTMSPGTRSVALTCIRVPSRTTLACGVVIFARASTLARAFISCWVPITTLSTTRNATIMAVDHSWISMLTPVTAISIRFIESLSWTRATAHTDGEGSAAITFGSVRRQPAARLGGGQPRLDVRGELGHHVLDGLVEPGARLVDPGFG